ncbi:MAG: hypothetical protein JNM66_27180 [Bryobacterales bacterium]|nr:hypothetical protein [Bryobacterales bacterium]
MQQKLVLCAAGLCLLASISARADVIVDLKNGVVTETFNTAPSPAPVSDDGISGYTDTAGYSTVKLIKKPGAGCATTPYEAVVEFHLTPGNGVAAMKKLSVLVEYEGTPTGWNTHLGDDVNNNGYGGGTSLQGVAELQVVGEELSMYTSAFAPGAVDKLFGSSLKLSEGSLHFNVANQSLTVGQPYTILGSNFQKALFDFTAADKKLYAGFNRVIANDLSRKGCGAKKVHLVFE